MTFLFFTLTLLLSSTVYGMEAINKQLKSQLGYDVNCILIRENNPDTVTSSIPTIYISGYDEDPNTLKHLKEGKKTYYQGYENLKTLLYLKKGSKIAHHPGDYITCTLPSLTDGESNLHDYTDSITILALLAALNRDKLPSFNVHAIERGAIALLRVIACLNTPLEQMNTVHNKMFQRFMISSEDQMEIVKKIRMGRLVLEYPVSKYAPRTIITRKQIDDITWTDTFWNTLNFLGISEKATPHTKLVTTGINFFLDKKYYPRPWRNNSFTFLKKLKGLAINTLLIFKDTNNELEHEDDIQFAKEYVTINPDKTYIVFGGTYDNSGYMIAQKALYAFNKKNDGPYNPYAPLYASHQKKEENILELLQPKVEDIENYMKRHYNQYSQ